MIAEYKRGENKKGKIYCNFVCAAGAAAAPFSAERESRAAGVAKKSKKKDAAAS
jgi:hypothetical protein